MNLTQEKVLFHLTGKLELSQLNIETLQQFVDEVPYFGPAYFFLTLKIKQQGIENDWLASAQKTALFFSNTFWLNYQIDENATKLPVDSQFEDIAKITSSIKKSNDTVFKETGMMDNKIAGILSNQLANFKKPITENEVLDIDAVQLRMHTIDYFASQGIKIDLSSIPQDKLTKHLLKFTDWLKQVKNTNNNAYPTDLGTSLSLEKAVAETAKNSNKAREILTETMADVLVKQGQKDKAIQLYIKLSFLNPEKSSYFAAKIEQLKGI